MKNIEIDEELYQYIATNTQYIGESASSILRRLLNLPGTTGTANASEPHVNAHHASAHNTVDASEPETPKLNHATANESIANTSGDNEGNCEGDTAGDNTDNSATVASTELSSQPDSPQGDIGSVFDHLNKEEMAIQRGAVGRFLLILAALYRVHGEEFSVVYEIRGRDRLYFADTEAALEQSGSSTKPRPIPESPYWVITNSNTTRKKMMLTEATKALGYSESEVEEIRDLL